MATRDRTRNNQANEWKTSSPLPRAATKVTDQTSKSRWILVVDDDEALRRIFKRMLERAGFSVYEASNGAEALGLLRNISVAAMILDFRMPGLSGRDVLREIKRLGWSLPVLIASGSLTPSLRTELYELGAAACIDKPLTYEDLLAVLRLCFVVLEQSGSPSIRVLAAIKQILCPDISFAST